LGKALIKINSIALANIVAGKKVVTELIQHDVNSNIIVSMVSEYLEDVNKINNLKNELKQLKNRLGNLGASEKLPFSF
jgi:lipid-A-disaccharide synthase